MKNKLLYEELVNDFKKKLTREVILKKTIFFIGLVSSRKRKVKLGQAIHFYIIITPLFKMK